MKDVTPITCFIQRSRYGNKEPLQMPNHFKTKYCKKERNPIVSGGKGAKQDQGYPLPQFRQKWYTRKSDNFVRQSMLIVHVIFTEPDMFHSQLSMFKLY
jgi:hypothetical protein